MHATSSVPLHSPDFYAGDPYPAYRELRATAPVCWNDVTKFWALLKYEDIRSVSSSPAMVTSTDNIPGTLTASATITFSSVVVPVPVGAGMFATIGF